ncbi:MAG: serine/threonine-protein kinase PknK [Persicimonas sp.]
MRANSPITCGPFDLLEVIGEGGMAQVWRGVHRAQQMPVAVKVITGAKASDPEYHQRFEREVQAVAGLDHPGIVSVFDYGRISRLAASCHPSLAEGSPYLAMEFARGGTIRRRNLICDWRSLQSFIFDLLDALAYAHARGVIHRDIKPDNILCQIDGARLNYKLSDFGIAHAGKGELDHDTRSYDGASAGTPHYMPPEQLAGDWRDFGPWTDLYAVGCLAYELACGRRPFQDSSFVRLANMHLNMPFPELEPRLAVPDEFDAYLRKLTAKKPSDRFLRAADAAYALSQLPGVSEDKARGTASAIGLSGEADVDATAETRQPEADAVLPDAPTLIDEKTLRFAPDDEFGHLETKSVVVPTVLTLPVDSAASEAEFERDGQSDTTEFAPLEFDPPPPLPESWRTAYEDGLAEHLIGVGLGLFGLRSSPFVDREEQREVIWNALRGVYESGSIRGVSLHGGAGTGKSRLVEWMCRRAHELGAATVLEAPHSEQSGPSEGLPRMLDTYFASWSLPRAGVYERVRRKTEQMIDGYGPGTERYVDDQASALTEMIRPAAADSAAGEQSPRFHFSTASERHVVLENLLRQIARERPVILWLDDIIWGNDALGLVEHLLGLDEELPLLVLMTARAQTLADHAEAAARLRSIEADSRIVRLQLGSLEPADHAELIERTLGLDARLAEQVRDRTEGNPLFAVQLIGDWVSRGILEVGRGGFSLREGAVGTLPRNIHDLWLRRVDKLLEEFPVDQRRELLISLELAATLGQHVDEREWAEVCRLSGVRPSEALANRMIQEGLIRRDRSGASFVHGMLPESLCDAAERAGRAAEHHLACVEALGNLYPEAALETAQRRALHLIGAGQLAEALIPLKEAVHHSVDRGDHRQAQQLLARRVQLCDELGLSEEHRHRVENAWVRAQINVPFGEHERALEDARWAAEVATRHGWRVDVGHALLVVARVLRDRGQYQRSLELIAEAREHLEAVDDAIGLLFASFAEGFSHMRRGELGQAREKLGEALVHARRCEDQPRSAEVLSNIGYAWLAEGEFDRARAEIEAALEISQGIGSRIAVSSCLRHLGEIARFEGRWPEAREYYQRALQIERSRGSRNSGLDELNLALVDLAEGDYGRVNSEARRLVEHLRRSGQYFALPIGELARAASAAGLGRRDEYAAAFQSVEQLLDEHGTADRDMAWLADICARQADEAGWAALAERARALAERMYGELGK